MAYGLVQLISLAFRLFELLILARILLSWVQLDPYNPIVQGIFRLTEPILAPIRRMLPQTVGRFERRVPASAANPALTSAEIGDSCAAT